MKSKYLKEAFREWETKIEKQNGRLFKALRQSSNPVIQSKIVELFHCNQTNDVKKQKDCHQYYFCPKCQIAVQKQDMYRFKEAIVNSGITELGFVTFASNYLPLTDLSKVLPELQERTSNLLESDWVNENYIGSMVSTRFEKNNGFWRVLQYIGLGYNSEYTNTWDNPENTYMKAFGVFNKSHSDSFIVQSSNTEYTTMKERLQLTMINLIPLKWKTLTKEMNAQEIELYDSLLKERNYEKNYSFYGGMKLEEIAC